MSDVPRPILVLALGNDAMGDDGAGLAAARVLRARYGGRVDVLESGEAGLALLEFLEGRERALLLDTIATGTSPAGTMSSVRVERLRRVIAPSPHYAGLPEVLDLARRLAISVPREIAVLAVEVRDPYTVREGLTPDVEAAIPALVRDAAAILNRWLSISPSARADPLRIPL